MTMAITALFAVAQDFGRENGLGIRLTGDITFNQGKDDAVFPSFYGQVIGTKLGVYYKFFINNSHIFIEPQVALQAIISVIRILTRSFLPLMRRSICFPITS